ncbi:MAG: DUF1003 domain-containing protein [Nanoarchaeota archaeon]|nr:DUF1003 domain-containing protein [Nanoarchaeota archaeon]
MSVKKKIGRNICFHDLPHNKNRTLGQKAADNLTKWAGSWKFIIILSLLLLLWMFVNILLIAKYKWDPYPFILLNLFLSFLAAFQAPIILMSQNRTSERDRKTAVYDYEIDRKSAKEVDDMQRDLEDIKKMLQKMSSKGKK